MTSAVLTRLIRLQREQIAQLKAFGYSSRQVGVHYVKFAIVIVADCDIDRRHDRQRAGR
jgi:putative ABC transport system permease protein